MLKPTPGNVLLLNKRSIMKVSMALGIENGSPFILNREGAILKVRRKKT